jgi:hypothetical protein
MHSSSLASLWRRVAALVGLALLVAVGALGAATTAWAATTELADESGVLQIDAPGKWREQKGDIAISASGFLGGVKRAELFGIVYDDLKSADAAARRWKEARTAEADDAVYTHAGDTSRWTAHSAAAGSVDYVRALADGERAAVVWVRLSGAPGVADSDAAALLDGARLGAPPEEPAAGGTAGGGETGEGAGAEPTGGVHKDPDFRIQIHLPETFTLRKEVERDGRRMISARGPVGSDPEAFFDLYIFDEFDRADACGKWWREAERMGWRQGIQISGDPTSFKAEVRDEVWTRHVRIVATDAGVVGIKLDVASQAEATALKLIDTVLGSLEVLKPRPDLPAAPPGLKSVTSEKSVLQHEVSDDAAKDFLFEADVVEDHVAAISGLGTRSPRLALVRVYEDASALAHALRPLGVKDGSEAHWWVREGAVLTHGQALESDAGKAAVRMELTRASLQRRLGFRAPFWLERGIGHMVASAAYNKGRVDQPHPLLVGAVADAAPSGVELQSVRWWTHEGSAAHPEREAIAWSYVHFFLHSGAVGRKWVEQYEAFVQQLQTTGDPVEAGAAFDFSRETELAEDWQLWARKLE